jgi:hypothetical protein
MPIIKLLQQEKTYLREEVAAKFKENGGRLKCDTNRDSYASLREDMLALPIIKKMTDKGKQSPYTVGESQLVSLFMEPKKYKYLTSFINTCYLYIEGKDQADFFKAHKELVRKWESNNNQETPSDLLEGVEQLKAANTQLADEQAMFQIEKSQLEIQCQALKADLEEAKTYQNKWKAAYLWYGAETDEEEGFVQKTFKKELNKKSLFMQTIKDLADALAAGFSSPPLDADNTPLVYMQSVIEGQLAAYEYGGFHFFYEKTAWIELNGETLKADAELPQTCFAHYAQAILNKKNGLKALLLEDGLYLSSLLGMEASDYKPIILLAAFKEDMSANNSVDIMACHPSYNSEFVALTNYVLTSRNWWANTFEEKRRKQMNWQVSTDKGAMCSFVLSKPFITVRKTIERGLSIDIPLDKSTYPNGKMILSIQLARRHGLK